MSTLGILYMSSAAETQAVQVELNALAYALEHDRELFFQFFLHEQLTHPVPDFHVEIFNQIVDMQVEQFALAVPRGHAKTTIVKLAVVWILLYRSFRFIVYGSNTTRVAQDECRDIVNFVESENFVAVFGRIEWEKRNESDGLYIFTLRGKRCILRALGAQQQVRGLNIDNQRPELLILDDAEDDENTATQSQREKFKRWVFGPLFKATARHCKKLWIGNLVSAHCLLNYFCESQHWASVKYGAIRADGTPLWPDMFSLEYLKADFQQYTDAGMQAKWFAEMMNLPVPEGLGLITAEEITYRPSRTPGDVEAAFITIDPAFSQKTSADRSAIAVHGLVDGIWQIVAYWTGKVGLFEMFAITYQFCVYWRVNTVGIESVQAQAALISMFEFMFIERGMNGITVLPMFAGGRRKTERIMAWCALLKDGTYTLTEGEIDITTQLLTYDPKRVENDDDLIDACAYGAQMISTHLGLLRFRGNVADAVATQEVQVCKF